MRRRIIYTLVLAFITTMSFAQNKLKGKVVDATNNNRLPGATITHGGKGGTTSDANGMFSVDCSKSGSVTVSFVGYQSVTRVITNCNEQMTIALAPLGNVMDEVEITATSSQNKSTLYQPSSITKLTSAELKRGIGLFMDDAINTNVPGVSMNRRAVSSGQQINIRGYGNGSRGARGVSSNFDGQGYKVYLNGIPVTDAEGMTVLDDIDYGSVGNAEISKGPSGTLYGLAIAGAVNFNTIKPEKGKTSIGQELMIGNFGLQRYTTQFQMGGERSSLLLNYGHQKSDGYTIHNISRKDFVNIAGDFQPNAKQSINYYAGYTNSYDERSGELTIGQFDTSNFTGNIEYIKRNAHSQVYTTRLGIGHTYNFSNAISNTTTVFGTGFNSNASSAGGWVDKAATNVGLRSSFNTKFSFSNSVGLSGITGIETQRQTATTVNYNMIDPQGSAHNNLWKIGDPYFVIGTYPTPTPANASGITADVYTTTSTTSLFTEWTLALAHDLSITGGIGLSNMKLVLDDRFYVLGKPTHYDTSYKGMVSPHFAINKVFNKHFSAYAAYSKGYKAPVTSYFFIPYTTALGPNSGIINSHLKPEVGNQFEIGTKGSILKNKLIYQLAFFDAVYSSKMTTVAVPNPLATATLYSYVVNGGKQDDKGIEALVKYTAYESEKGFFTTVAPFGNFTYADYTYKDFQFQTVGGKYAAQPTKDSLAIKDYSGHSVPGVAKYTANLGIDVTTKPGLYANITWSYKGNQEISSIGTQTGEPIGAKVVSNGTTFISAPYHVGSYNLLGAKLGYKHSFGRFDLDAYFAAANITNTKYPIMIFVNQFPDSYIAGPKTASVFGGINLKYNLK